MRTILRISGLVAGLAASLAAGTSPASADLGTLAFTGTAYINCFGCGLSTGTATLDVVGSTVGRGVVTGSATATYTVFNSCGVSSSASGTISGAINVSFNLLRVGALAVITTAGEVTGAGTAAFAITDPVGLNPCGGPLTASFVGALAGV